MTQTTRRTFLGGSLAALAAPAIAQNAPLKVGLMLPFSGTFATLGENIAAAFELCVNENGGKFGGRAVTLVRLDDESDPSKAPANVNRLLGRDNVDALVGTVHSGVVMALVQAAREKEVPLFIPNAGNVAANLSYAAAHGKVEKLGMGSMATWRILDMEFFKETEA